MQTVESQAFRAGLTDVAAALFVDGKSVSDAVSDLRQAGFEASQIGVAFSTETAQEKSQKFSAKDAHLQPIEEEEHSFFWKLRHAIENDSHHHGVALNAEKDVKAPTPSKAVCSEIDLEETLRKMGVAEARIQLLGREIGADGALLLVETRGRIDLAESILERNRGWIRTDMATEHSSSPIS